ncbi:MAG: M28 family peptidase [Flavobacteriales bacterium]
MGSAVRRLGQIIAFSAIVLLSSCGDEPKKSAPVETPRPAPQPKMQLVETPRFDSNSAYNYIQKQVDFGPRVPNTDAQKACAKWLESELKSFGLEVITQKAKVTAYNNKELDIYNIMGRYKPEAEKRILLCAHWDTRPYADRDTENRNKPIDGANDGASGVGVLLELARAVASDSNKPNIGFDIVFFDAEDYGQPQSSMVGSGDNTYCLGSQYWSTNIPIEAYKPAYGILLDMVGAANATFPKEQVSMEYAPEVMNKVWDLAHTMGHKNYFKMYIGNPITDDHLYLYQLGSIPTIDIIHYEMTRHDFGSFHHTHADNMDIISKKTLQVVGDVLLQVIYQE